MKIENIKLQDVGEQFAKSVNIWHPRQPHDRRLSSEMPIALKTTVDLPRGKIDR
jgi:hypothetical protein